MHPFVNAPHLRLDISRPKSSLEVLTCKGGESFDQSYSFELEVVSPTEALDAHELLFSAAWLHRNGSASGIHGHIQSIVRSRTQPVASLLTHIKPVRYQITFGPRLGLMAYRHNQRVFQGMSAEQIIVQLLGEHGIDDSGYIWQRTQPCLERDYCAQYCESDLKLLQRLCKEEGMHYYFLHSRNRHITVFTDNLAGNLASLPPESNREVPHARLRESRTATVQRTSMPPTSMQRACVVGAPFEPVKLDERGRLKVRFDWGNQGDGARFSDCWLPIDLALAQGHASWWGGMEVVVSFRGDNPDCPYITDRLWDPDINPRTPPDPLRTPRRVLTTRIDKAMFLDESQQFSVDDQMIVRMARHNEMHFRVGASQVTIDSKSISLSGLKIMLSAIAETEG